MGPMGNPDIAHVDEVAPVIAPFAPYNRKLCWHDCIVDVAGNNGSNAC
jgi:hypothetical protein